MGNNFNPGSNSFDFEDFKGLVDDLGQIFDTNDDGEFTQEDFDAYDHDHNGKIEAEDSLLNKLDPNDNPDDFDPGDIKPVEPEPFQGSSYDPGSGGFSAMAILASLFDSFLNPPSSPLVIDMDGDGVELISLVNSTVQFDIDLDGFTELTGWVAADDALLAYDVNGNGIIDDQSELFGNSSAYANGFLSLAALDSNADGVIDVNDAAYADLLVWQDVNSDGYSAAAELSWYRQVIEHSLIFSK